MTGRVAAIERHPIKAHGREYLSEVALTPGRPLPWDRTWAVAHEAARLDEGGGWAAFVNFSIGSKAPKLTAIDARLDEGRGEVTLSHPDRPDLTFRPDDPADLARFLDWVRPLCPADRAQPARIVAVPGRGMTDTDYPSVSILNLSSGEDLGRRMGMALSPRRWRANFWLEGLEPWVEEAWPGRAFRLGEATVEIVEPIVRCKATMANPETGRIDADTLAALTEARGQRIMGVYARVTGAGRVALGDRLEPA